MPKIDLAGPANDVVAWLLDNFGWLFDAIATVSTDVVGWIEDVLTGPPALVVIALLTLIPLALRRWGIAAFAFLAFALIDSMELWTETMQSLAVVLVATVVAVLVGVPLGIWAARHRLVSILVRPLLDLMQTTPPFVYLIPAVFFFGVGVVPGVVATAVFALAPAVRLTELGIRQVDAEVVEAAQAFGAPPRRVLRDVQLPLALPSIMAGVNQVIMLALSMVVVAGLAGAEGLGAIVTGAVTQLDIGAGFEGGLAVVILAIYLDRVTGALAAPRPRPLRLPWTRGRARSELPAPVPAGR
ncbi:ABC transporter permease subunit [Conexibacter sp. JD483]|uniref:ABC transporter permease n=1 Tax=unclassified Conexibacter TaxID=2627773 RepID=UPI002723C301|nr:MULTISPECIES: ABC transporter permease subunit [unclassified Conexibacter]MDO8186544.1 ABC transporter permease subunit [Conexibacter sp. CPCC 205706]MDO8200113.1 ABC transporter permease subunit [Conexibacter sp. CPCC 205762]MDR9371995.1 ABC transporter permease subunit [Conexibacter sp. JD483]